MTYDRKLETLIESGYQVVGFNTTPTEEGILSEYKTR